MKTFREFIIEAHSRGKFRGTRTPEEIENLRKKRREYQSIETTDTSTNERIRNSAQRAKIESYKKGNKEQTFSYGRLGFYHTLPVSRRYTPIDSRGKYGMGGQHLDKELSRKINQADHSDTKSVVLPSKHPDANYSSPEAAKKADKLHLQRLKKRKKKDMPSRQQHKEQKKEQEQQSRQRDRDLRKEWLKDTVGKIPGQLRN